MANRHSEMDPQIALDVQDIHKFFGGISALSGVTFDVRRGETLALLGPSGCGKSTLLNVIAGLEAPEQGEIYWQGRSLAGVPAHRRGFGLMFQDYALFPHLSVARNISFGLEIGGGDPQAIRKQVDELLELVALQDYAQRKPDTLSGGEQQRVALARALAPGPLLLMLDEPLGALDRTLRDDLLVELRSILQQIHQTAIYVTHDQEEAFGIADRVAVMRAGKIEQLGSPRRIYNRPANEFVARFLGLTNFLEARIRPGKAGPIAETPVGHLSVAAENGAPLPNEAKILLRPDAARLQPGPENNILGVVVQKTFRGSQQQVLIRTEGGDLAFEFSAATRLPEATQPIEITLDPARIQIFPAEGRQHEANGENPGR